MSHRETYRSTLSYALSIAGSEQTLAEKLGVPTDQVVNWLYGVDEMPTETFLQTIDIVLNATRDEIARSRDILGKGSRREP